MISEPMDFVEFPKIARLNRECIITEKIDGTNAQVYIGEDGTILAGSRTRWIQVGNDNFGFALWVQQHAEELKLLGPGRHFGEWWGLKIQRGYDLFERRFSLFNVSKWEDDAIRPKCCHIVPVLYRGLFSTEMAKSCVERLRESGSLASPGFMKAEGIVCYHLAGNVGFKATLEKDDKHKGEV
jgi:hypothetical protein